MKKLESSFLRITNSKGYQRISLKLKKETIQKIDNLAEILKLNRTLIIEAICIDGIKSYVKLIEKGRNKLLSNEKTKNKKDLIDMGKKLKTFNTHYN